MGVVGKTKQDANLYRFCLLNLSTSIGHEKLPDLDVLAERFFKRTEFKPDPHGTNVLFAFYAQHFSHQFFRTDHKKGPGFYAGKDGVSSFKTAVTND